MRLRTLLQSGPIMVVPGIYDAMGALLAERAGFSSLYLSGASISYTRLGRPDIGLVTMDGVAHVVSSIRERVDLPLIVDADTGYGNALNVKRTVALFERAGASAIQLEDQTLPKRCGHLAGKTLVSTSEMVGKIRAALDARRSSETLLVARTDAIAVEGFEAALERGEAYVEAGADILFIEAPRDVAELEAIGERFGRQIPLLANIVEGGRTPVLPASRLEELGYRIAIYPGGLVRAVARVMEDYFASLQACGSNEPFRDRMLDFNGLNELVGLRDMIAEGERYA